MDAPVAALIQIDPPKKARVLQWYNERNMRVPAPQRRLPQYSYDTSTFADFAGIVEQHVSDDMNKDVIEALGNTGNYAVSCTHRS
jgi:hypothetical protein